MVEDPAFVFGSGSGRRKPNKLMKRTEPEPLAPCPRSHEAAATEDELAAENAAGRTQTVKSFERERPARKPFPDHRPASAW
jgi:hypothetical protein